MEPFPTCLPSLTDGTTHLLSVATNGLSGNGPSFSPLVSADGPFVAFVSDASNLVPGDTNETTDVFLRDRLRGETLLVSVARDGAASGWGPSDSPACTPWLFRWLPKLGHQSRRGRQERVSRPLPPDLQSGITTRISIPSTRASIASLSSGGSRALALSAMDFSRSSFSATPGTWRQRPGAMRTPSLFS